MSALQRAREHVLRVGDASATDDEVEVAMAWARGEITSTQARVGLGQKHISQAYVRMAIGLRRAVAEKRLVEP